MILIFTLWIFHLYVATFQQHLQMEYTSLSWNDVRLHQGRLHQFCYALSCLCYWYVRFVLIAGHCICHRSWLVTMCDIWPVVGVSSIMNATCRTWPYLPSWAFVSNSSFNGAPLAQTLVSNVDYCLPFVLSLIPFDLCPSVCWFWLHRCCLSTFLMLIGCHIVIVFSTYFIFCSYLNYNQITSIQEGTFSNLPSLTYL